MQCELKRLYWERLRQEEGQYFSFFLWNYFCRCLQSTPLTLDLVGRIAVVDGEKDVREMSGIYKVRCEVSSSCRCETFILAALTLLTIFYNSVYKNVRWQ
ncbi:hypothetical protein CEXT_731841 [Caerostris extrusa]|uniref:Uncharacterized protein n=1 Tax=Caerostris extrusa TaxID=172846 RepID=A0AAV4NB43_CAEEX|nr:hypothetical protein CEXT_731841 [Caerostris extrusa]